MSIVANKFIPMSLADISSAINGLCDNLAEIREIVEANETATLTEAVSEIQLKLDNLQASVDELSMNSDPSLADAISRLSERVTDLEDITTNFFGA